MDTFIPVFLTLISLSLVAVMYLACTAPHGWEDDQGFHEGPRLGNDFTHGKAYTND